MARDKAYREVEQKIEEARRSGAKELDLSGIWGDHAVILTELPERLSQLTQLELLDISHNQLAALPEWLSGLTQLRSLNLSSNRLTALPESLGQLTQLQTLRLSGNQLTELPESLGQLTQLQWLNLARNQLATLPESLCQLTQLELLDLSGNRLIELPKRLGQLTQLRRLDLDVNTLTALPDSLGQLSNLQELWLGNYPIGGNPLRVVPPAIRHLGALTELILSQCEVEVLPDWVGELKSLVSLSVAGNHIKDLPPALVGLQHLTDIDLRNNPLNPELAAAFGEGLDAIKRYLRVRAEGGQVVLNEAKLILIGEGEVGKSCLLGALRGDAWEEGRPTTHGIEIKPVKVINPESGTEITLNGWDFGGQRVYRPTHQLFFSAPAVYLVVWKPREGPQQGFVKDWIKLVKHREPEAKILVVATHGGPKERQPDIDRQEIWDLFGKDMVLDFFLVESKPEEKTEERKGIENLKQAVARVAASLPEVGRAVPRRWEDARQALKAVGVAYLPLEEVMELCRGHKMDEDEARDFVRISHRLGHLIHYEHDPLLRDIVVLKPDWLSTAMSFVLDDKQTRLAHGLVEFSRLSQLWNDPERPEESRYDAKLHPLFLRLMERFDLSYKVAVPSEPEDAIGFWQRVRSVFGERKKTTTGELFGLHYTSLIAQLVPDIRPDPIPGWFAHAATGDAEQAQICRITETKSGQSAAAEGLFFLLIVRLHKYSLGRLNYAESVHWQRGLVLEDDYGARALLEHTGNDVRITVRSPYPERFLAALTYEVKWLVEHFWAGLRCDVMVPCLNPTPCTGLFEVRRLIENKKRNRPEQPCPVCNEWQNIELLLHNAPAARPIPLEELLANHAEVMGVLREVRLQLRGQHAESMGRFDSLDASSRETVSKVEAAYTGLMRTLVDEAKDGPRLFSFEPVSPGFFDRPGWLSEKFRLTLWCEHSRLPLPALNGDKRGVYELTIPRDWVVKAAPFLKLLVGTLSLVVPVAASATKLMLDETSYQGIEEQLELSQSSLDSVVKGGEQAGSWLDRNETPDLERGEAIRAQGAILRELHAWLKEKDASFGGLVRVQNKRQEFLWVHPQFEREY
jgi:GTPase SAR1 family protein